ncbi:ABC transporter permease subunit [Shimia sp. SDUM112013]|uniref:ABC transporter permease n=1 Tax=Shimia sp. SDUM112013 TaxID=3136160 RepID=UPI0032F08DE4
MSDGVTLSQTNVVVGKSLWQLAFARFLSSRFAVINLAILAVIAAVSFVAPLIYPHSYATVYREYILVPPSLTAYPDQPMTEKAFSRLMRAGRYQVESLEVAEDAVSATITARKPIKVETLNKAFALGSMFQEPQIITQSEDGKQLEITAAINRQYFVFGTDENGRDLLARIMAGGRISILIGIAATLTSIVIGVMYGAIAGYVGGRTDAVMMRFVDILYGIPLMFFVIVLVTFFGRNILLLFVALGAVEWLTMARIVRGQTMSLMQAEFVTGARVAGLPMWSILRRHVLPNVMGPVVVYATLNMPAVILAESFLSFLGLGVQEPMASWGVLIADGARRMETASWLLIFPGIFLILTVMCINFVGDSMRDAIDPKR